MFQRLMKEPLLHFLILGGILFAVATSVASRQSAAREVAIDKAQQSRLAAIYRTQTGKDPDAQEMNQLVEQFVHDEVLSREATALGLDGNDEIIRRRLVQKMTFLMEDNGANAEPDDAALHRYYQEHPQAFQDAERVWFRHCYFATDQRGADGARNAAAKLGDALNAARRDPLPGESDSFPPAKRVFGHGAGGSRQAVWGFGVQQSAVYGRPRFVVWSGAVWLWLASDFRRQASAARLAAV